MNLTNILETTPLAYFLLDASGVLYTDKGPINDISSTVKTLQNKGHVYITTNNSSFSIPKIQKRLAEINIIVQEKNIISSGLGLKDNKSCHDLIKNKTVYIFGNTSSFYYVTRTNFKSIVHHPDNAEVIVLTSSYKYKNAAQLTALITSLKKTPRPIICCNPDQHVIGKDGFINVIGYYAAQLEKETKLPILWFGKPYSNYSQLVKLTLKAHHPDINLKQCCFFDDNLSNVMTMQHDLSIHGCWIKESGISNRLNEIVTIKRIGKPTFMIKQLHLPLA